MWLSYKLTDQKKHKNKTSFNFQSSMYKSIMEGTKSNKSNACCCQNATWKSTFFGIESGNNVECCWMKHLLLLSQFKWKVMNQSLSWFLIGLFSCYYLHLDFNGCKVHEHILNKWNKIHMVWLLPNNMLNKNQYQTKKNVHSRTCIKSLYSTNNNNKNNWTIQSNTKKSSPKLIKDWHKQLHNNWLEFWTDVPISLLMLLMCYIQMYSFNMSLSKQVNNTTKPPKNLKEEKEYQKWLHNTIKRWQAIGWTMPTY